MNSRTMLHARGKTPLTLALIGFILPADHGRALLSAEGSAASLALLRSDVTTRNATTTIRRLTEVVEDKQVLLPTSSRSPPPRPSSRGSGSFPSTRNRSTD